MEMERVAFFNLSIYMDHDSHAEVLGWVGATGTNVPYKARYQRCHPTRNVCCVNVFLAMDRIIRYDLSCPVLPYT